jgi:hypothetical protein
MTDAPDLTAPLTTKQLQARLVQTFGDDYRFTERTLRNWTTRPEEPMPCRRKSTRAGEPYLYDWDDVVNWLEAEADRQDSDAVERGTIASHAQGILVTIRALARELETHVDTLTARVRAWNIQPILNKTIRGGPVDYYRLRDILDALTASARAEDPDSLPAQERDAFYRSELRKDELRRNRRELIEVDDARRILGELIAVRRDFYDLLTDTLERRANLNPAALEIVEKEIDGVRAREAETILELQAKLRAQPLAA